MEIAFVFGFQVRTARFKEFELQRFYPKYLAVKKTFPPFLSPRLCSKKNPQMKSDMSFEQII